MGDLLRQLQPLKMSPLVQQPGPGGGMARILDYANGTPFPNQTLAYPMGSGPAPAPMEQTIGGYRMGTPIPQQQMPQQIGGFNYFNQVF